MRHLPVLAIGAVLATLSGTSLLCQAVQEPVGPTVPGASDGDAGAQPATAPNEWFSNTGLDLGTHLEGEIAKGTFEFKNPHEDATHRLSNIQPSCQCSKAVIHIGARKYVLENEPAPNTIYRVETVDEVEKKEAVQFIAVGPGESGRVDVEMDLRNVSGPKSASVQVRTSDEAVPMVNLAFSAISAAYFSLTPPEINLNKMNWQDKREFGCQISSPIRGDFEITGHDPLPSQMKVEYHKEMRDGKAVWIVDGSYGPNVDPQSGGGIINFQTDIEDKKVSLRVMAYVEGPLNVKPGTFVPLGRIRHGEGTTKVIEFEPTDDFDLQVEEIKLLNLSVPEEFVTVHSSKVGKTLRLELTVSPDAPRRLIRGDIEVTLNHPAARKQELQFNGFVR